MHKKRLAFFSCLLLLAGCGFSPIYGPHDTESRAPVVEAMNNVAIENIPDRNGQVLRNHLIDRIYTNGRPSNPAHRLAVKLSSAETELGIQKDSTASRSQLNVWAAYVLKDRNGKTLFSGTAHSVVSYSKFQAQYGTVTAQRDAFARATKELGEQIVNRLSLFFAERAGERPELGYPSFLLPREDKAPEEK
jgi:LPS-assembly lipoprotein